MEASHIDGVIYTKIPKVEIDPIGEFMKIVTLVIFHGLCRKIYLYLPYMSNAQDSPSKCIQHYLCNFFDEISIQKNGYQLYW